LNKRGSVLGTPARKSMAILWAANPRVAGPDIPFEETDVDSNKKLIDERGAVYWDSSAKRNEIRRPLNGYIYHAGEHRVKYKCRLECMISLETLLNEKHEHRYVPQFRMQCLTGRLPNRKPHKRSETWIKILKICPLKPPLKLRRLTNWNTKKRVRVVRAPIYVEDLGA
jgi:hypothetical protein